VPLVPPEERIESATSATAVYAVVGAFGFHGKLPDVPRALKQCRTKGCVQAR